MGRIIIGFKNPHGFYNDLVISKYRHLDDLITDYKRFALTINEKQKIYYSNIEVFALGEIDDNSGKILEFTLPESIIKFPEYTIIKEEK